MQERWQAGQRYGLDLFATAVPAPQFWEQEAGARIPSRTASNE